MAERESVVPVEDDMRNQVRDGGKKRRKGVIKKGGKEKEEG